MITYKQLKLYEKYKGNADMFQSAALWWQRNKINAEGWRIIHQLLQDLKMISNGLAAPEYVERVENTIRENFEDEEAITKLRGMAKQVRT